MSKLSRKTKRAKRKARRKKVFGKVTGALKKTAKKIGQIAKNVGGTVLLAPLVPLLPAMKIILNKKGIKSGGLKDTAQKFYEVVTHGNYEDANFFDYVGMTRDDDLENFSEDDKYRILAQRQEEINFMPFDEDMESFDPVTVTALVAGIVKFFKAMKKRKANKEALRPEEEEAINSVEMAAATIAGGELQPSSIGGKIAILELLKKNWWIAAVAVVAVVLIARK